MAEFGAAVDVAGESALHGSDGDAVTEVEVDAVGGSVGWVVRVWGLGLCGDRWGAVVMARVNTGC